MAEADSTRDSFRQRLLAVLDYDGIPPCKRAAHLVAACSCSLSTARRWLFASNAAYKLMWRSLNNLARGLDVDLFWLWDGSFQRLHPRTFRIHAQQVKHYPKEATDQMMRLLVASWAGHRKADNLMVLVNAGRLTLHAAARLM